MVGTLVGVSVGGNQTMVDVGAEVAQKAVGRHQRVQATREGVAAALDGGARMGRGGERGLRGVLR